ncbi:MAG TPA: hypothetical protein VL100_07225 [Croceibacterium sp.]|nr:hypothetical protein [Croceibacterium sp.]
MADAPTGKTAKPKTTRAAPKARTARTAGKNNGTSTNRTEAKQRFGKALEEARAGAAALGTEARAQARTRSEDWVDEAKAYGRKAQVKSKELAVEGKARASDALAQLGKAVSDNAGQIDERFGTQYGDYARSASRSMQETAARLDAKSLDELGDEAREFVRKSPGLAIGIAAVAGYMIARVFRSR